MTTALQSPALTVAAALAPHLPLDVDLEARPLPDGTLLVAAFPLDGWAAIGAGPVTLMLAGPLVDALSGDPTDPAAGDASERLALALADACRAIGVTPPEQAQARPAGEVAGGLISGPDLAVAVLGTDDLALGLVLVAGTAGHAGAIPSQPSPVAMPALTGATVSPPVPTAAGMELLRNVEMQVTVELGRTHLTVRDLLGLRPGAVVELDRAAGGPVDLLVNGTLIARGEVVVVDEEYGVRITEIVGPGSDA